MFKSFKEYRLAEMGDPVQDQAVSGLKNLQMSINTAVEQCISKMKEDLRKRDSQNNPFNVMRQNLPFHQKVRNWWNRFWSGNTSSESQDYSLEFLDFIPVHEQEAFDELRMLVEYGPVNQAIETMIARLDNLENTIKSRINAAFNAYTTTAQSPPEEEGEPHDPGEPLTINAADPTPPPGPEQPHHPEVPVPENPPEAAQPSPQSPPEEHQPEVTPPADTPEEPSVNSPEAPREPEVEVQKKGPLRSRVDKGQQGSGHFEGKVIATAEDVQAYDPEDFKLVDKVQVGGKWVKVFAAKYDFYGNLVAVRAKSLPKGYITVPPEIGKKAKIDFGAREGELKQIVHDIVNRVPPVRTPEHDFVPSEKPVIPLPPREREEVPASRFAVPDDGNKHSYGDASNYANDIWDDDDPSLIDQMDADRKKMETLKLPPAEERLMKWIDKESDYVNPHLLQAISTDADPVARQSIIEFLVAIGEALRYSFCLKNNDLMDTKDQSGGGEDMGKLQWVASLTPEQAKAAGKKIKTLEWNDKSQLDDDLKKIFQDHDTFTRFINEHSLSRSKVFVENLRNKQSVTKKTTVKQRKKLKSSD